MEEQHLKIMQYLDGALEGAELKEFEQQLKTDSRLAEELASYQEVQEGLSTAFRQEKAAKTLQSNLAAIGADYFKEETKVVPIKSGAKIRKLALRYGLAAAAIALLLLVWQPWTTLFDQYNDPVDLYLVSKSGAEGQQLGAIEKAYRDGKFEDALQHLSSYLENTDTQEQTDLQLLKGICLLELDRASEALPVFQNIYEGNSLFAKDGTSTWYLALTHLKLGDREACAQYLREIPVDPANDYSQKAQKLLKEL